MVNLLIGLFITVACFYYGIIYENSTIITLGYALFFLILFSVIEVVWRLFTMKCHLDIPITMAEQGMPITVVLKLKNKGVFSSGRVDVRMNIRKSFEKGGSKRWYTIPQVPKKLSAHNFKVVLEGAGIHEIRLIKLRIHSMLGIVSLTKKIKDFGTVLILPDMYSTLIRVTEATKNFIGDADVYDEFRPGHDMGASFEIREYREKDKLQSIHWKLSAKTEDLMVRESSYPKACAIVLLLESKKIKSKAMEANMDAFWKLAASISFGLMDGKTPHFVAWFSRETGDIRRIRVDDEESFYIFLNVYLRDYVIEDTKSSREEYRNKYKNEWYLHDVCINNLLEVYRDEELIHKLDVKKIKDECEKMELLL